MLVYRAETIDGVGAYSAASTTMLEEISGRCHNDKWHLSPFDEPGRIGEMRRMGTLGWGSQWRFACPTIWHLRRWFNARERDFLKRRGVRFWEYDVPDHKIVHGKFQLIYRKRDGIRLREILT